MTRKGFKWFNESGKVIAYFMFKDEVLVINKEEVNDSMLYTIKEEIKQADFDVLKIQEWYLYN